MWHIRAIVDGRAVIRTWVSPKQEWHYEVKGFFWFNELMLARKNKPPAP